MQTIRARLFLNYFIVLSLGMLLAAALVWLAVGNLYISTQRDNLLAQAQLIAAGYQDAALPTQPVQPYSQTSNIAPGIHTRLIGDSGAVLVGLPLTEDAIHPRCCFARRPRNGAPRGRSQFLRACASLPLACRQRGQVDPETAGLHSRRESRRRPWQG